jgi:hypothetical protein
MSRHGPGMKKKCEKCRVALNVGGCLFGCSSKERLVWELDLLIQGADSRIDPLMEQLSQCPEAFEAGDLIERMFRLLRNASEEGDARILPPPGAVMSPFA